MKLFDFRLLCAGMRCAYLLALGTLSCIAGEVSDTEVEALFNRHPESAWLPLVKRWEELNSGMVTPVENLSLPLDYHPGGQVKARLFAEKSQIFPDGMIFAIGVKVNFYDPSGKLDGYLKTDDCLFDREASHGYCKGRVEVVKNSDTLKGIGMYFSITNEFVKIISDGEIRTLRFKGNLGRFL